MDINFGKRLRDIRERKKLSLGKLSEMTGVNKSTLQRYETGITQKISVETVKKLEAVLDLPEGYLLNWDNDMQRIFYDVTTIAGLHTNIKNYDFNSLTPDEKEHITNLYQQLKDISDDKIQEIYTGVFDGQYTYGNVTSKEFIEASECLRIAHNLVCKAIEFEKKALELRKQSDSLLGKIWQYFETGNHLREKYLRNKEEESKKAKEIVKILEEYRIKQQ